LSKYFLEFIEI